MEICREQFDAEFQSFCEAMDIELDGLTDQEKQDVDGVKDRLYKAVLKGKLRFDDEKRPVLTTSEGTELVFNEPTAATLKTTDSRKQGEDVAKLFLMLADMTRSHPKTFAQMKMRDFKVCKDLFVLFMGA